ncbi:MAG: hypothetical protein U1C33_03280, partial [Candidatus Cloacimonadaceae bacterium]|nr:hypothetical protein [Candidatus Cloacimonadaceae bacterium]
MKNKLCFSAGKLLSLDQNSRLKLVDKTLRELERQIDHPKRVAEALELLKQMQDLQLLAVDFHTTYDSISSAKNPHEL